VHRLNFEKLNLAHVHEEQWNVKKFSNAWWCAIKPGFYYCAKMT
jgi:hypothetical protein